MKPSQITLMIGALLLVCCKATEQSTESPPLTLPSLYSPPSDTTNAGLLSWREYFTDSILVNLIDLTLKNNKDMAIAMQRIEEARSSLIAAKGALLPLFAGGATAAIRRYGLYTMDGAGNATTDIRPGETVPVNLPDYLVGIQSSWEADISGKLRQRKKAAEARILASIEGRNWLITNLVVEVATTYYELVLLDAELDIIRKTAGLQEEALLIVSAQKQYGASNELVLSQFEAQLLNTRSLEFEALQRINDAEIRLNLLAGRFPLPIPRCHWDSLSGFRAIPAAGIPSALLRNRPDIRQAEWELQAAKADLKAAKRAFYPSLNITASAGYQAYKPSLIFETPESAVFSLAGGLWGPLFNRSAIRAQFRSANAYQIETLYHYQKTILTAYSEVHNSLERMKNLEEMNKLKGKEAIALTRAVEASTALYRTGRATYLEVLLTQEKALEARVDLIDNMKLRLINSLNLYRALGGGWY